MLLPQVLFHIFRFTYDMDNDQDFSTYYSIKSFLNFVGIAILVVRLHDPYIWKILEKDYINPIKKLCCKRNL